MNDLPVFRGQFDYERRESICDSSRALPLLACACGGLCEVLRTGGYWHIEFKSVICGERFKKIHVSKRLVNAQRAVLFDAYRMFGRQEVRNYVRQAKKNLTQEQIDHLESVGVL